VNEYTGMCNEYTGMCNEYTGMCNEYTGMCGLCMHCITETELQPAGIRSQFTL